MTYRDTRALAPPKNQSAAFVPRIALPLCLAIWCFSAACGAGARPPETGTPRAAERSTNVVTLALSAERRDIVLDAWRTLLREQGVVRANNSASNNSTTERGGSATRNTLPATLTPELQPLTRTIRRLPSVPSSLRLPSVGDAFSAGATVNAGASAPTPQQQEAERESLRRFIADARTILGVEPADLSLVRIETRPDGMRSALYRQKPFLYELRGGYGIISIDYARDGRVLALSSMALPEARSVARAVNAVRPTLTAADALTQLAGKTFTQREEGAGGIQQQSLPTDLAELRRRATVREVVVYPLPLASAAMANPAPTNAATNTADSSQTAEATNTIDNTQSALVADTTAATTFALRLAWEVAVAPEGSEQAYMVYIDAVSGEIVAAVPATNS